MMIMYKEDLFLDPVRITPLLSDAGYMKIMIHKFLIIK